MSATKSTAPVRLFPGLGLTSCTPRSRSWYKIGLDAAIFLRFLRMCRWLFTAIALLTCAVLIPVNVVFNLKYVPAKGRDALSMLTIRDLDKSNWIFAHVVVTYVITLVVIAIVWYHWREVVRLRREWFRSPEYLQSFYARTLMVTDVPRSSSRTRASARFSMRDLEAVLVKYLKGGKIGKKRPTVRIGGFLGCGGETKDAIDYYTYAKAPARRTCVEEFRAQIDLRKPENYGFASMAAVPYAHIVANMLRHKHPKGATITLAPNPRDIVWRNLGKSPSEIRRKQTMGWIWLNAVCAFNTLTAYVPFLEAWSNASPGSFTFVSGVLPPAVSALFGWALPIIMRKLTKYMGAYTHSRLDRAVVARYYAFLVISQLIIFTLIGVIQLCEQIVNLIGKHKSVGAIFDNFNDLPGTINKTYIDQSSYWLTYFPLRGFLVLFDLAQIINLFIIFIKTHSNLLFMGTVALFFAPLAPLVAVAAAVVFWISSWVYKYQLMFVFVSKTETGGRMWNVVVNRLLAGHGLAFGFGTFKWLSTVPPMLFILAFKAYIHRTFQPSFRYYMPTEQELREAHVHSRRADAVGNRLEKRFGHPRSIPSVPWQDTERADEADEMGGQAADAQVVAGGVKIAAVEERDLEYDPAQYQRDRGDDWDTRSVSSSNLLADAKSPYSDNGRNSPAPSKLAGYDRYLAQGPQPEIEMTRLDTASEIHQPLLPHQAPGYFEADAASRSNIDLGTYGYSSPPLNDVTATPLIPAALPNDAYREAPLHRPYPSQGYSAQYAPQQQHSQYSPDPQYPPSQQYPTYSRTSPQQRFSPDSVPQPRACSSARA
ncbi:hypothetical protein BD414DRAFT_541409 [Trametes punicea]|nr:hypothetical protein BD414DRAFT_541409 [Trametes punicea]